jgi:hypothetical protein
MPGCTKEEKKRDELEFYWYNPMMIFIVPCVAGAIFANIVVQYYFWK